MKSGSVWSDILTKNRYDKTVIQRYIRHEISLKEAKSLFSNRQDGQWQFGDASYNIRLGSTACKHQCKYCYIAPMFARWHKQMKNISMEDLMPVDPSKVRKNWKGCVVGGGVGTSSNSTRKMYFFPSSSDTFTENASDYIHVANKILESGNEVMFVTKPTMRSLKAIHDEITGYPDFLKENFHVFITFTSKNNQILRQFEPYSSLYEERLECLKFLTSLDYEVNVMMEPYLSPPLEMVHELLPLLPNNKDNVIAIGEMNYSPKLPFTDEMRNYLFDLYKKENVIAIWKEVENNDRLFLKKDSIKQLMKYYK